jgi:hypothetical protein
VKSRENVFFDKKEEDEEQQRYDTEVYVPDKKIDRLLKNKKNDMFSQFEWILFQNKVFNIKE